MTSLRTSRFRKAAVATGLAASFAGGYGIGQVGEHEPPEPKVVWDAIMPRLTWEWVDDRTLELYVETPHGPETMGRVPLRLRPDGVLYFRWGGLDREVGP